ncbi:MAG: phage tail sheath family protein, partial [Phaeodactylibacter sp.]|nr:phage tail sheath family protein [Phaeodactylibacter sp.]
DRFAILDIYQGYKGLDTTVIADFRAGIGTEHLDVAACYYPWLNTSITTEQEVELSNAYQPAARETGPAAPVDIKALVGNDLQAQQTVRQALCQKINQLPPGPALAGIYYTVDNDRGVWTAPANLNIEGVLGPIVAINDQQQQGLTTDISGKSINAIRAFYGQGPAIVWGARTLDGNANDLRYINVKRTIIYIQQSIKLGLQRYAFYQNAQATWDNCKADITSFLDGIWRAGGLMGSSPDMAFAVQIGLGSTMTPQDILEGKMRVSLHCAFMHPAEFTVLNFEQQMAAH